MNFTTAEADVVSLIGCVVQAARMSSRSRNGNPQDFSKESYPPEQFEHIRNPDALPANAWPAPHLSLYRDSIEAFQIHRISCYFRRYAISGSKAMPRFARPSPTFIKPALYAVNPQF